mgnify:CR=1 FL=1
MSYNALFADAFKYGLMFGKDVEPGQDVSVSVTNQEDVLLAVKKAYIDMSPRTFKSDGTEKAELNPQKKETLFAALAQRFCDYMQNGAPDFEKWHNTQCEFFITEFRKILKDARKNPADATYGKAQKIVNMTFKYLYCFDDAKDYSERFAPCHMALDSYILAWVQEWYLDQYNKGKPRRETLSKTGARHLPNWSHLAYSTVDGVPQYIELQEAIRQQVKTEYAGMTPFEAEFLIWYTYRRKAMEKNTNP